MTWACLRRQACGPLAYLTVEDLIALVFPCSWTLLGACSFCYYAIQPAVYHRDPKTLPMYFTLLSTFPAFLTAFNYYIFQRSAVMQRGMTRGTVEDMTQLTRLFGLLIMIALAILSTICGMQFVRCESCNNASFGENIFWCGATLAWLIIMACNAPSPRHQSKLIYIHETSTGGPHNVPQLFGRVAMAEDTSFMVDPQDATVDRFVRAGVHPDMVVDGKVAPPKE
ncbi:uncharacterized protein LOC34619260 [Cyclospora cayetanensis]|uniref:Uncharacterized protein LOC34619260 n=2 Tax=Cyclospora cayetanensis TaxID=88456 RepID=A0A6P5WD62_9EIME|nr:uncharacterized protein LOC34619260 [Cyclospora cayetanensis]OEH76703.1 hypothetical protein cyc_02399 [Cyclospora cayetanensis]